MRSHSSSLPATAADLTRKWLSVRPLVVIAIGFAVSIGFCNLGTIGICILLIAAVALSITPGSGSWMRRAGAIASVLGLLWAWMAFHPAQSDVSRLLGASRVNVSGVLVDAPERHTYGWTAILSVDEAQRMGERAQSSSGLLKVYLGGEENIPAPQAGDRIRVSGALESPRGAAFEGGFDETNYLRTQGIFATMRVRSPRYWHLEGADRSVASMAVRGAAGLRQDLLDRLSSVLPQAQAGLLAGIMLGSRSILPPVISDDMAQAGISHITASSGTNVAFAALCVCWIAARLGFSRRMRSVTGIVGVTI